MRQVNRRVIWAVAVSVVLVMIGSMTVCAFADARSYYNFTEQNVVGPEFCSVYDLCTAGTGRLFAAGYADSYMNSSPASYGYVLSNDGASNDWQAAYREEGVVFSGVSAYGTDHVWAVGKTANNNWGLIRYFDGSSWSAPECPKRPSGGVTFELRAVSALGVSHVWAVGMFGDIVFFNGAQWVAQEPPTDDYELYDVVAISPERVYAVGSKYTENGPVGAVILFDGVNWKEVYSGGEILYGVDARSWNSVWAVGAEGTLIWYNGGCWDLVDDNFESDETVMEVKCLPEFGNAVAATDEGSVFSVQEFEVYKEAQDLISLGCVTATDDAHLWVGSWVGNIYRGTYMPPSVSSVSSKTLYVDSEPYLSVYGSHFRDGATVRLRKAGQREIAATDVVVRNESDITSWFDLAGAPAGTWDVYVENDDGQGATLQGALTIKYNSPPRVSAITPSSATNQGRVSITDLAGSGFKGGASVRLKKGGQNDLGATDVTVASDSKITCVLDLSGAASGNWDVYVENDDGQSGKLDGAFTVEYPSPVVQSVTPGCAANDGLVKITNIAGTCFRDGAVVSLIGPDGFGDGARTITASDVKVASGNSIGCTVGLAGAQPGFYDVGVTNPDGKSGLLEGGFEVREAEKAEPQPEPQPVPQPEPAPVPQPEPGPAGASRLSTWYLAEGSTDWGFSTDVIIENPNGEGVTVEITYMTEDGAIPAEAVYLPPASRVVVNPAERLGQRDFSTRVTCREGKAIAVDRTMGWLDGSKKAGDFHSSVGVNSPANIWYLPEGSSAWGFECWLLIQNPNQVEATCRVTYMLEGGGPRTFEKKVPANSRRSYDMARDIGAANASIKVESDIPVIPERAMYRNDRREGHESIGTTTPSRRYYLAEGSTDHGFITYVLVQNPSGSEAQVTVTYMTADGEAPQAPFSMPANSRKTIKVNGVLPGEDFSTLVDSTEPIIAERAMYWDSGSGEFCHDSIGMSEPHMSFYLPDGRTSGWETYTLVQNPNPEAVTIEVSYLTQGGTANKVFTETVPANSRRTYTMSCQVPDSGASTVVRSKSEGKRIMCERAMYLKGSGAGTSTIGGYSD